jgi:hypothetical protein
MYYSKNNFTNVTVPKNYSGNAFKLIDETEKRHIENSSIEKELHNDNFSTETEENCEKSISKTDSNTVFLNSFLSNISVEDLLLLGIIFVIHQENPNDSTLLLLLILLLAK